MHPSKFQRVSRLASVTARHSSSGRQPNFAALNTGRHLYLAGWPSRWALAHISSLTMFSHSLLAVLCCSVAAETEAEHIRVDLAMDEAIDLKRSATMICYNRDFVRICLHIYLPFLW